MGRSDLERLSKEELIELVLELQRPGKTSRTSSKPPSTDRKEQREQSKPGGAKPGHEGHNRVLAGEPDRIVDHRPVCCPDCGVVLPPNLPAEAVSVSEMIDLPPVKPVVEQHRRLAVRCPACQARVVAPRPAGAAATPFGPRLHATAVYLKTFQALSYERLQAALSDLFGLTVSQGGLMNMLRRAEARFTVKREAALSALRRAEVVACDETGVRIEGSNSYHWVFRCDEAVVHHAAPTRAASVATRSWTVTGRQCGYPTATPPSRIMRIGNRPAWPISRAPWPTPLRPATTRSPSASSCGSAQPSPWRKGSGDSRHQPSKPSAARWSGLST